MIQNVFFMVFREDITPHERVFTLLLDGDPGIRQVSMGSLFFPQLWRDDKGPPIKSNCFLGPISLETSIPPAARVLDRLVMRGAPEYMRPELRSP